MKRQDEERLREKIEELLAEYVRHTKRPLTVTGRARWLHQKEIACVELAIDEISRTI